MLHRMRARFPTRPIRYKVSDCARRTAQKRSALALFAIGYRAVSMSPTAIGPVKAMLLGLDIDAVSAEINAALDDPGNGTPVRALLERFANDHNIPL